MISKSERNNVMEDLTAIKHLEDLPPSILQWLDHHNHDIVMMYNENGENVYTSQSVKRKLGYEPLELIGTGWHDKLAPADIESMNAVEITHSDHTEIFNVRVSDKYGKWIWFETCITKRDLDTQTYYIALLKDISDKKEAEELMIRSEKMSVAGQLAAGIAHEIRNPLTSLKGFIQLLQGGLNQKEEYYKIMLDEIDKMEAITSELLFISKPVSNDIKLESINEMINDVIYLLRPQGKIRNIDIVWQQGDDCEIQCNRSQIKQVLINIIKNALEAMAHKGKVVIQSYQANNSVNIDVSDEGSGIPQEIIHKLKEPFFTTKEGGTGLGLMITHQILTKHNGTLNIFSKPNEGSTFQIILPVQ
ncbi:ATP-binding protein [Lentibacillus saliphilus]|uniref:ATP-binding protein n=1 Tax=Lentibacillus saliphilus TaxID=2737028 RepID=UPI001FEC3C48|nr:ATP-binding protein [Lentibacillus saliphilus]